MSKTVDSIRNPTGSFMLYPTWYYYLQTLLMVITGIILLVMPVHSTVLTSGIIALYLFLSGVINAISVISDQSGMGWKFLIGIAGIFMFMVALYYFYNNIYSFTGTVFFVCMTSLCLVIGSVQTWRGFSLNDPVIRLMGVITLILGIIIVSSLYFSVWWIPVVTGVMLIIGGVACFLLKNSLMANRPFPGFLFMF